MQLIEILDGINDYDVSREELIWKENKVLLNRKLLLKGDVVLMNSNNALIVLQMEKTGTVIIDRATRTEFQIESNGPIISSDFLLLGKWNDDYSSRLLFAWDFKKNTKVWESDSYFGKPFAIDNCLFGSLRSNLYKINPNTGEPIWQLDLSQNHGVYHINNQEHVMDVQGYVGLYNGNLYIKAGNRLILGIDINSGEEVFKYEYSGEDVLLDNLSLDHKKGEIFSIGSSNYFELNLLSGKAEITSISSEVKKNDVETTKLGSWEGNLIYFWEGITSRRFGIFDKVSKTIKSVGDVQENESGFPSIKNVKHSKDRLYVLDGQNRLNIFSVKG